MHRCVSSFVYYTRVSAACVYVSSVSSYSGNGPCFRCKRLLVSTALQRYDIRIAVYEFFANFF